MITALLGPTNTGKTHRAIERMLEHPTGMIGLPLRLLAREVYDKISARVGERFDCLSFTLEMPFKQPWDVDRARRLGASVVEAIEVALPHVR